MRADVTFFPGDGEGEVDIEVVLSHRNLAALLAKLEGSPADSKLTIMRSGRQEEITWNLMVTAEKDETHYQGRIPAGEMHPETERLVSLLRPGWSRRALD